MIAWYHGRILGHSTLSNVQAGLELSQLIFIPCLALLFLPLALLLLSFPTLHFNDFFKTGVFPFLQGLLSAYVVFKGYLEEMVQNDEKDG